MLISIVVPCYKSGEHIHACLDSILNQTHNNIECICVDDCSPDNTLSILQGYAEKDERVKVYSTEKNSGSANYPLDFGVSKSKGEFVCLVGHDDVLERDYLKKLVTKYKKTSSDIILSQMRGFINNFEDSFRIPSADFDFQQVLTGREAVMKTIKAWEISGNGALIRTTIWKNRTKYLDTTFAHMNADEFAFREILVMSKRVAFTDAAYHYRLHDSSITHNSHRRVETLITDEAIVRLFSKEYGRHSNEFKIALTCYAGNFLSFCRKKEISKTVLKKHFLNIRRLGIYRSLFSLLRKISFLLPFSIFHYISK